MKLYLSLKPIFLSTALLFSSIAIAQNPSQATAEVNPDGPFTVTIAPSVNGSVSVSPAIPANGQVAKNTKIIVTATPNSGYDLDASFYSIATPGARFASRVESSKSTLELTITGNTTVGATFIDDDVMKNLNVTYDVVYAKPGVKALKYDVYAPKGARNLPCIIIMHGGGWSSNTEEVMRGLSRDLVAEGKYVVFNIDYRWINTGDGDTTPNIMANLIEDVYGAIAHIQEHAAQYGGDPTRIAVTGDSAGGHLSASVANMCEMIGDGGFGVKQGVFQYKPTYMPAGKSVDQVRQEITNAIKAAAPSYGVFTEASLANFVPQSPEALAAVAPINHIPSASVRVVPQYLLRGDRDNLIKHEEVQGYVEALQAAGQTAKYVLVEGSGHAFLDWKTDERTQNTYNTVGHKWAVDMRNFFDSVFYK